MVRARQAGIAIETLVPDGSGPATPPCARKPSGCGKLNRRVRGGPVRHVRRRRDASLFPAAIGARAASIRREAGCSLPSGGRCHRDSSHVLAAAERSPLADLRRSVAAGRCHAWIAITRVALPAAGGWRTIAWAKAHSIGRSHTKSSWKSATNGRRSISVRWRARPSARRGGPPVRADKRAVAALGSSALAVGLREIGGIPIATEDRKMSPPAGWPAMSRKPGKSRWSRSWRCSRRCSIPAWPATGTGIFGSDEIPERNKIVAGDVNTK